MSELGENTVYVGSKAVGSYIGAVLTQFGDFQEVHIVARGKDYVGKAVDVAEVVKNSHDKAIADIETDTQEREDEDDGQTYRVSTINITMTDDSGDA